MSDLDQLADGLRLAFGVLLIGAGLIWVIASVAWWAFAHFLSQRRLRTATHQAASTRTLKLMLSAQRTLVRLWLSVRIIEILGTGWMISMMVDVFSPHIIISAALVLVAALGMAILNSRDILLLMAISRYLARFPSSLTYAEALRGTPMWQWTAVPAPFADPRAERYRQLARRFTKFRSDLDR